MIPREHTYFRDKNTMAYVEQIAQHCCLVVIQEFTELFRRLSGFMKLLATAVA